MEKYMDRLLSEHLRPQSLRELTLPLETIKGFERMVARRSPLNLLFYGKPGIGKTSAARILIREIDADCCEIDGSFKSDKAIVNQIHGFATARSLVGKPKICFIDEADHMSTQTQDDLRYLIENVSETTRFLMTANDIGRMTPAIQSRCLTVPFDIPPKNAGEILDRIALNYREKLQAMGFQMEIPRLRELLALSFPDMRRVANRLELELV